MRFAVPLLAACLTFAAPVSAQEGGDTDIMRASLAAGYKAAFTCSATFNAGQTQPEIEANELTGIYPGYREAIAAVGPAQIDDATKTVSVSYSFSHPPRIVAWRPGFGCIQLPVGADVSDVQFLPGFANWQAPTTPDRSSAIGAGVQLRLPVHITERLEAPLAFAFDGTSYGEGTQTSAVLIVRGGEVVGERYARGIDAETPQRTWSVAKSITATILGAAANQGIVGPDSTVLLDAWSTGADPRRDITLANLLHMASGLDSGMSGARADRVYFGGGRVIDHAITNNLEAVPGARFKYANNDTMAAMRALREALDDDARYHNYPYTDVLWKIGARRTTLEADWNGDFVSSSQIWTTARDLARIGQLYLNDGVWAGEQILHPDWREFVTTPAPDQPDGEFGYGGQFWLMGELPGVPRDAFAAMGHRGQYLVIIPSQDLVIVRRGYDESGGTRFDIGGFTRDIVRTVNAAEHARRQAEELARLRDFCAEHNNRPPTSPDGIQLDCSQFLEVEAQ